MPPTELLSIRKALIGDVSDFVSEAGFGNANQLNIVVDLIYHLSEYREEEKPYFPAVFLIRKENAEADVLAALAPGTQRFPIGVAPAGSGIASKALKDCAALATSGWAIYLEASPQLVSYGLFRSSVLPFSVSAVESLQDPNTPTDTALLIRNCSSRCVELISGFGNKLEISLTSSAPPTESVSNAITRLANSVVAGLDETIRDIYQAYFEQLFNEICRETHGTLISVVPHDIGDLPSKFKDGVILTEALSFPNAIQELMQKNDALALSKIKAQEALLRGMFSSDGITILANDATVRAFRVFVKADQTESEELSGLDVRGGARTRAFELMKLRLGNPLNCVFFRSQDGRIECVVNK